MRSFLFKSCLILLSAHVTFEISALDVVAQDAQGDQEKLQGTWQMVRAEVAGKEVSQIALRDTRMRISKDSSSLGTFRLDPTKEPKAIDMTPAFGPNKGKTVLGIYEIEGDDLKICVAMPGKERPTEFTTKSGSGHALDVYRREKVLRFP